MIAAAGIAAFDLLAQGQELREKLRDNTVFFRGAMKALGFDIIDGSHPIVPVMFRKFDNDARLAQQMARELYAEDSGGRRILSIPSFPRASPGSGFRISAAQAAGSRWSGPSRRLSEGRAQARCDINGASPAAA